MRDTLEDWEWAEWMLARNNLYIDLPQKTYHNERLVNTTRALKVS
ncbi:MAG: hypothetical protein OXU27_03285 [Candidatus Poribacteria bacterium]|nr:hypothetical protein [Candidatus Poribacteria bacterium]